MYTRLADDPKPAFAHDLTATDLVILEFDHWSNPKQPKVSPTSTCWFDADLAVEWAK